MRRTTIWLGATCVALGLVAGAAAQGNPKKELVQKVLQLQQAEIESVAREVVERPAARMDQEAAVAMERQVPPDKREAMAKAIDTEIRKYLAESYPLVRERALRIAPVTIGAALEEKMSEDELRQLVAWLDSPVKRKFEQIGPDMRNGFIKQLLAESQPVVDPKLTALDARIRVILGVPPASGVSSIPGPGSLPPPKAAARAASK
jgi:hypothetical protein